jgi:hypothetical protein
MHKSNNYKNAMHNVKHSNDFEQRTLALLESKDALMKNKKARVKSFNMKRISIVATTATLVFTIGIIGIVHFLNASDFDLAYSNGVKVNYTDETPPMIASVTDFEESDIFRLSNLIISGNVLEIDNIKVDFGNRFVLYHSIITLKVSETLKGEVLPESTITIYVPHSITGNTADENDEIISSLSVGENVIFMAKKYTKDDFIKEKGATFYYQDICEYGLPGNLHFAIINTDTGLLYAKDTWQFPSTFNFDEATAYIKDKLNQF